MRIARRRYAMLSKFLRTKWQYVIKKAKWSSRYYLCNNSGYLIARFLNTYLTALAYLNPTWKFIAVFHVQSEIRY